MTHMIGEISLSVSILLLIIVNHDNGKRIKDLEKQVAMLTIRAGLTIRTGREEP